MKDIIVHFNSLKAARKTLEKKWTDAYTFTFPSRATKPLTHGKDGGELLFDSTATEGVRLLTSSLISGLTPSSAQWIVFNEVGGDESMSEWLSEVADECFVSINTSNYTAEVFEFMLDVVIAGSSGLFISLDDDSGSLHFEHWELANLYYDDIGVSGVVDTVMREVSLTLEQAINQFGLDALPQTMKDAAANGGAVDDTFKFIHAIYPRKANGRTKKNLPIASTYVHYETKTVVKDSGFHENPVIIPRWLKQADSPYAVGAVDAALPDIKMLNKLTQIKLTAGELSVNPPVVVKADGSLHPSEIKLMPKGVMHLSDVGNIRPLDLGSNLNWAMDETLRIQSQIRQRLMSDQLQPIGTASMTATEVQVRVKLIRQLLGTVYGRFQSEFLQPMLTRVYGLLSRAGRFPDPENANVGKGFYPTYISPVALAQKQDEVLKISEFENNFYAQAQAHPEILAMFNPEESIRHKASLLGIPGKFLKSQDEMERMRQAQAQAQAGEELPDAGQ